MGELNKILNSDAFKSTKGILKCVIGKDMDGKEVIFDLRKAPHVLITGDDANKNTKYILAIIESLASVSTDKCLALALINMESSLEKYNSYLYSKASLNDTLEAIYNEMENRYEALSKAGKRSIEDYNDSEVCQKMKYIVAVINGYDKLIISESTDEDLVLRIAQKSRAVGIHLIISAQNNVLPNYLLCNLPTQINSSLYSNITMQEPKEIQVIE